MFDIETTQKERGIGRRVWNAVTEEGLKENFERSKLRVADGRLVIMTDDDDNVPLFEHLLTEGTLFPRKLKLKINGVV